MASTVSVASIVSIVSTVGIASIVSIARAASTYTHYLSIYASSPSTFGEFLGAFVQAHRGGVTTPALEEEKEGEKKTKAR
jgi:hypothetical protein